MALSAQSVEGIIKHALSGAAVSPELGGAKALMNRGGRVMMGLRWWRWARTIATLDLVAGQTYVELPIDFGSLDAQAPGSGLVGCLELVSDTELIEARANAVGGSPGAYLAAEFTRPNPLGAGQPIRVLELDRAVAVNTLAAFTACYFRKWPEVVLDSDEIAFPDYMDELYLQIVRGMAQQYQFEHKSPQVFRSWDERLAQIKAGETYASAARQDETQNEFGAMAGGHVIGGGSGGVLYGMPDSVADIAP